jgi:ferredoxin
MIVINVALCDECGTCIGVCPADAILLDDRIRIDDGKCISCGNCITVCPAGALIGPMDSEGNTPDGRRGKSL